MPDSNDTNLPKDQATEDSKTSFLPLLKMKQADFLAAWEKADRPAAHCYFVSIGHADEKTYSLCFIADGIIHAIEIHRLADGQLEPLDPRLAQIFHDATK